MAPEELTDSSQVCHEPNQKWPPNRAPLLLLSPVDASIFVGFMNDPVS